MQAVVPLQYRPRAPRRPSAAVYRRRRLVALLCAAALLVAAYALAMSGLRRLTGASGDGPLTVAGRPVSTVPSVGLEATLVTSARVIVQSGDTLWSIARRVQPGGDVRPLVATLSKQRDGRPLQAGERIELPRPD